MTLLFLRILTRRERKKKDYLRSTVQDTNQRERGTWTGNVPKAQLRFFLICAKILHDGIVFYHALVKT